MKKKNPVNIILLILVLVMAAAILFFAVRYHDILFHLSAEQTTSGNLSAGQEESNAGTGSSTTSVSASSSGDAAGSSAADASDATGSTVNGADQATGNTDGTASTGTDAMTGAADATSAAGSADGDVISGNQDAANDTTSSGSAAQSITAEATMLTVNVGTQERIYAYNSSTARLLQTACDRINAAMAAGYTYGDFAGEMNPAFYEYDQNGEQHISCDRFVGWVLYDMGYAQDETMRLTMGQTLSTEELCPLEDYMLSLGFETILNMDDLQAGDIIICNNPDTGRFKVHTYILADHASGNFWNRYDAGIFYETGFSQPVTTSIENNMIINIPPYDNYSYNRTFDRAYRIPAANLTYTSSDPSIAEVSENGTVTGISPGKCTVTVQSADASLGDEVCEVEIMVG